LAGRRIGTTEFYGAAVDFQPVRDAYSSMSEQYISLFDGD